MGLFSPIAPDTVSQLASGSLANATTPLTVTVRREDAYNFTDGQYVACWCSAIYATPDLDPDARVGLVLDRGPTTVQIQWGEFGTAVLSLSGVCSIAVLPGLDLSEARSLVPYVTIGVVDSGADFEVPGAADQTMIATAISRALNAPLASPLRKVVFLPGTYNTTASIDITGATTGLTLEALIPGTVTIYGSDTDYTLMSTTKDSVTKSVSTYRNITIKGIHFKSRRGSCLTISNCTNPLVEDCHFEFTATPLIRQGCTFIWCKNVMTNRLKFTNTAGNGLSYNGVLGGSINNIAGYGGANSDDMVDVDSDFNDTNTVISQDIEITNIHVDTVGRGCGIRIEHAHNVSLANFNIRGVTSQNGAGLYINTGGSFDMQDVTATNGTISGCTENGLVLEGAASENIKASNIVIRDCGDAGGSGVRAGVRIGAPGVTLVNVTVDGVAKVGTDGGGIMLYKYDATVIGCTMKNCVTGLRAWNGDALQSYPASLVLGNTFASNSANAVTAATTAPTIIENNLGL